MLSEGSLQNERVTTELRKARQAERQSSQRKLFPVPPMDMETLREYFIPDFSRWKEHDAFEAAFARLLKDLRAEERAK